MVKGILDRRVFRADQVIFREGQHGDLAYIVASGKVYLSKNTDVGERLIAVVGENEIFGEMALIDDATRMATATALEPVVCTVVNRAHLEKKLAALDVDVRAIFRFLLRYVRDTLPYELRGSSQIPPAPTQEDVKARVILDSPGVSEGLRGQDTFMHALFAILAGYVRRRLPPGLG